jgi:hypothetical protein
MSNPQEYTPKAEHKIQALPSIAEPGTPSRGIVIQTNPAAGPYPEIAPAEEPVEVFAHALGTPGEGGINAIIHWRKTLDAKWHQSQMQPAGSLRWKGKWIPPTAGDYQWMVRLQPEKKQSAQFSTAGGSSVRLLRAERRELTHAECFRAAREPLSSLLVRAQSSNAGVFLLPALFPQAANNLVGHQGNGHYTIATELGNAFSFGELTATISHQGKALGLTIPMTCSPGHPFRLKEPGAFSGDGTPRLEGKNRQLHQENWEAVFRYWIVQGIDIFEIPDPGKLSLPFWQSLIRSIRDDFPDIAFTASGNSNADIWPHLLGIGFSQFNAPAKATTGIPAPLTTGREQRIFCTSSNAQLVTSIRKNADGELLLRISNDNSSATQFGHIHLSGTIPELKESERYHMHNLTDGRSCHWVGTTNFVSLKAGEQARTLRIERNH